MDVAKLAVQVGVDGIDKAKSDLKGFDGALQGAANGAAGLGKAAAIGLGAGLLAAGAGMALSTKEAGNLEQAVANISTIKPDINTSAVFNSLNELQTRVPQSAAQLGDSLYDIFSSVNVSSEEGLQLVEKFAKGAVGAGTDAKTFGTAAMGVMNAYGLSVGDADHISDVFFNTVKNGVVTGSELASNFGVVTQSAKAAGVDINELGGFIAGVTKEGGPAAQNINNLSNMFMKITTKEAQAEIKGLGIATTTATGEFRPVIDVLTDLQGGFVNLTEAEQANVMQAIFPDAQARQGAQVIMDQLDFVKASIAENIASSGAAEAAYTKMSSTFNSQTVLLGNAFKYIETAIGAEMLPAITPLITAFAQGLPGAMETLKPAMASVGELVKKLASGDFKGAFTDMLGTIGTIGGNLATKLQDWGKQLWSWVEPMIPPLLVKLGELSVQALTWIGGQVLPLLTKLGDWGKQFVEWIAPMIPPLLVEAGKLYIELERWLLTDALPKIVTQLAKWGAELWKWVAPMIPPLLVEAGKLAGDLWTWITLEGPLLATKFLGEWVPNAIAWVAQAAIDILPKLALLIAGVGVWIITTGVPELAKFGVSMGGAILGGIGEGLGNLAGKMGQWIGEQINKIDITIGIFHIKGGSFDVNWPSISAPSVGGGGGTPTLSYSDIPFSGGGDAHDPGGSVYEAWVAGGSPDPTGDALRSFAGNAAGTDFWRGGPTWVGERGPEIVNLPRGSQVTPNDRTGGQPVNIYVTGNTLLGNDQSIALQLARLIAPQLPYVQARRV